MTELNIKTERLRLWDASIKYADRIIISHASLSASSGEMIFVTGKNGSGKSTLIRGIAGLLQLSSGTLTRASRLSYVPQIEEADRDFPAKVSEIVITGTQRQGKLFYSRRDRELAEASMHELGLLDIADRELTTLSGGQLRRVFIARALCGEPELLLLDEPCAGLDVHAHEILFAALRRLLREGCAILMVTHDDSDIDGISPARVINISEGRIANHE